MLPPLKKTQLCVLGFTKDCHGLPILFENDAVVVKAHQFARFCMCVCVCGIDVKQV